MNDWSPASWRSKPALQQPVYPSASELEDTLVELSRMPPLVTPWEIDALKAQLADAAEGRRFLLQGGDCAERFADCDASIITDKLRVLLQMSLVLVQGSSKPVIRVGRFAGQYAKPRSEDFETRDGVTLPSYRGDLVNHTGFTSAERTPDPRLLLRAHGRAALTLNFIRSLVKGGFADLHHPEYWDLDWVGSSPLAGEYRRMVKGVSESLRFLENVLGIHAGEIEVHDDGDISGIAVNLAARVEQKAADGELWTSSTVRDLMMGGSARFTERGEHELKGIDGNWRLFSVDAA